MLRCESYVKQDNLCHNKYGKNREGFFACSFFRPYEPDTVFMLTVCFTKSVVSSQLVKKTFIRLWYLFSDQVKKSMLKPVTKGLPIGLPYFRK